jgi:hypothetical protein
MMAIPRISGMNGKNNGQAIELRRRYDISGACGG